VFFYHPHISVLSGIAWDHINVFPTYENYCSQFEQYLSGIEKGAPLFYNQEDPEVVRIVKKSAAHLKAKGYGMPAFRYEDGKAVLETPEGDVDVSVFGRHNLLNMEAALDVCEELGIPKQDARKSIASFTGAAKRLEKLFEKENLVAYRDFAHAPSKLKATLDAVREAYPGHQLIACFELHTYSSLNKQFLSEYAHSMDAADNAVVYFSHHALSLKGLPELDREQVGEHFERKDLQVIDKKAELEDHIENLLRHRVKPVCLLLMSSGTSDAIDWNDVSSR
jgi:UDP-N-acetylmuramate: L-alanyl-gamma-D-glutamyl-meso-diaminopimelate ligase